MRQPCSSTCKEDLLCQAKSGRSRDKLHLCQDLKPISSETIEVLPGLQRSKFDDSSVRNGQMVHLLHKALCVFFIWNFWVHFV